MRADLRFSRREETRVKTITKALLHLCVVATTVVGLSGTALAQHRRGDGGYGTVSAQFNYGIWTGDSFNGQDLNAYGPGLGARGGYTLDIGLYIGANFDYFFGDNIGGCTGDSRTGFAIAPGLQFFHVFDVAYITAEIRYQTVTVSDYPDPSGVIFGIGVGAKF
jgi:hypothetical protein